jgi:hypothetical protein
MQNITLSAPVDLIESAREAARARSTTLNAEFRVWLAQYANKPSAANEAISVMERIAALPAVEARAKWSREDMNAR